MQTLVAGKLLSSRQGRTLAVVVLLIAALAYAYLFQLELRSRADMPLQVDELFFATCAARGLATGDVPISGCHDNKGPFIYVVYQALQALGGFYSLASFKLAAFALGALNAVLAGAAVRRVADGLSALLAAALVLLLYVQDPWFLALKPESLGTALVLGALLLLPQGGGPLGAARWLGSGLLLGIALATKQTFLFPLLGLCAWVAWTWRAWGGVLATGLRLGLLAVGAVLPMAVFAAVFWHAGRGTDFAAALVLYPMLYKSTVAMGLLKGVALRMGTLAGFWVPLLPVLMAYLFVLPRQLRAPAQGGRGHPDPALRYVFVSFGMFAVLIVSPIVLRFHIFPAAIFAVVVCGLGLRRQLWPTCEPVQWANLTRTVSLGVLFWAAVMVLSAWAGQAGNPLRDRKDLVSADLGLPAGSYAYIVGIWPKLYVDNGLLPASDVLYPTAFPGAPQLWSYREPAPGSEQADLLARLHRYNVERLLADFAATPPRVIVVVEGEGRAAGSTRASDIAVFERYIESHCRPDGVIDIPNHVLAQKYACQR